MSETLQPPTALGDTSALTRRILIGLAAGIAHLCSTEPGLPFSMIYVEEAHAEDEWPIATPAPYAVPRQHAELGDRLGAAAKLRRELPPLAQLPMYLDGMGNDFQRLYGAWPTRLYYFDRGELALKADAVDATFDLIAFWESVKLLWRR